jgi:putative protein-disulfide isomerase
MNPSSDPTLLYFADPMCSWCWGFSPVIHRIRDSVDVPIQMFMGGLNPGNRASMTAEDKDTLREHWQQVQQMTGRDFDFAFFEREGFVYDTEPACRAVIACFQLSDEQALSFMSYLQQAFYTSNRDITDASVLASLAAEFGLDATRFNRLMADPETVKITNLCFRYARHLKISGFPTLIGQSAGAHTVLTRGFQSVENIQPAIQAWLDQTISSR